MDGERQCTTEGLARDASTSAPGAMEGERQSAGDGDQASVRRLFPHQLVMTATPIPRTLAMAAYADLDVSAIDELPPGRTPVQTIALSAERRPELIERIRAACAEGRQVYWVCTLIEEAEDDPKAAPATRGGPAMRIEAQAAQTTFEQLTQALPQARVALVHGRMKPAEKQAVMRAFKEGQADLLVATTVIEVGVDVPNASLMVVEMPSAWAWPSCTSCAAGSGAARRLPRACCSTRGRCLRWPVSAWTPCARPATASSLPKRIWNCAVPANCSAPARPDWRRFVSPTWHGMRTCCRRCTHWPTRCWPAHLPWPSASASAGSAARPVTPAPEAQASPAHWLRPDRLAVLAIPTAPRWTAAARAGP